MALAGDDVSELARVVRGGYYPHVVLAGGGGDAVPLLAGRGPVDGRAAAYVCERFTCHLPVTEREELAKSLQTLVAHRKSPRSPGRARAPTRSAPTAHENPSG